MGVTLVDLSNEGHRLDASWWTWRPAIELIRSFNLLDDEMLERMGYNGCGGQADAAQAHAIGLRIRDQVLPLLDPDSRVLLDLNSTTTPDDGTLYRDDLAKNYSASRDWLAQCAEFCLSCQGFEVW